jgi:F-type H+-transporting ATPase subunit b
MRGIKRTFGKSALFALVLWFALAAGSVWASDHGGQHAAPADAQAVVTGTHGTVDAGHDVTEEAHGESGGAHGGAHAVDSLSPAKLKDLGFRVMNFLVLLIILVKFGAKPVADSLGDRRKQIRDEIEDLEAKKIKAEQDYREFSAKLESVEKDVDSIVEKAIAQAEIEKVKILEAAEKSADDIKRAVTSTISNEIIAAKRDLKNGVTEQAALMAEELIVKNLTAGDQVKIIEDYLEKVGAVQ